MNMKVFIAAIYGLSIQPKLISGERNLCLFL